MPGGDSDATISGVTQRDNQDIDEITRAFIEGNELLTRYRKFAANHPEIEFYTLGNVCFGARLPHRAPVVRVDLRDLLDTLEALHRGDDIHEGRNPGFVI